MRWGGRRSLFAELSWYFAYICVLQSSIAMAWWVCRQGNRRDDSQRLWGHVGSSPGMPVTATCHCGDARATAIGEGFGSALSKWTHAFGQASQYRCNSLFMWCLCEKYFFFSCFPEFFSSKTLRRGRETRRKMYRPRQRPLLVPLLPVTVRRPCLQDGAQPCVLRLANLTIGT